MKHAGMHSPQVHALHGLLALAVLLLVWRIAARTRSALGRRPARAEARS